MPYKKTEKEWGPPYNRLPVLKYWKAPPQRGTFFRLQVDKKVGISQVEVYERDGKSVWP